MEKELRVILCAMFSISAQPFSLSTSSRSRFKSDWSSKCFISSKIFLGVYVYTHTTQYLHIYLFESYVCSFLLQALTHLLKLERL